MRNPEISVSVKSGFPSAVSTYVLALVPDSCEPLKFFRKVCLKLLTNIKFGYYLYGGITIEYILNENSYL